MNSQPEDDSFQSKSYRSHKSKRSAESNQNQKKAKAKVPEFIG